MLQNKSEYSPFPFRIAAFHSETRREYVRQFRPIAIAASSDSFLGVIVVVGCE